MRIRNLNPLLGSALALVCLGASNLGLAAPAVSRAPAVVPIVGELQVDNETKSTELEVSWPQPLADVRMLAAHAFLETFGGDVLVAPTYKVNANGAIASVRVTARVGRYVRLKRMLGLDPPEEQALTESGMRLFKSSNLDPESEAADLAELYELLPSRQRRTYFLQVGGGSSFCVDDLDTGCGTDVEGLAYGLVFGRSVGGGVSLSLEYAGTLFTREAIKDFWKGGHHGVFGNVHFSLFQNLYTNLELFGGMGYSRYSANYRAKGGPVAATNETFLAVNAGAAWTQALSSFLEIGVRANYVRHGEGRICVEDACRDGDTTGLFRTLVITGFIF